MVRRFIFRFFDFAIHVSMTFDVALELSVDRLEEPQHFRDRSKDLDKISD